MGLMKISLLVAFSFLALSAKAECTANTYKADLTRIDQDSDLVPTYKKEHAAIARANFIYEIEKCIQNKTVLTPETAQTFIVAVKAEQSHDLNNLKADYGIKNAYYQQTAAGIIKRDRERIAAVEQLSGLVQ